MPELRSGVSEGEIVSGNYRILGIAGSGGMGVVYRALDLRLERVVALKFLPVELNQSERDKARFLREARIASSLDHPNIGVIHGVEEAPDGTSFIVMAYYEGITLAERLRTGPLAPEQAVDIAAQVARALVEAHSRGIVHRDVKPSNVMVTPSGLVKLVDFGLAAVISARTATSEGLSGTVAYMAPEQTLGERADLRCDIWALGVVLAEMITGNRPFHGETMPALLYAILNALPENIDALPAPLQPIVYRALSKEVEGRYGSCGDMLAALEHAGRLLPLDGQPGSSEATTVRRSSRREKSEARRMRENAARPVLQPARTRRRWPLVLPLAVVCILVGLAALVWFVPALRFRAVALFHRTPPPQHIAVLPYTSTGANPENTALIDGLMDSLAGRLSNLDVGVRSLWVVPNSVVASRHVTGPSTALRELGANLVVKGTIERDGSDIRLISNLIDTKHLRQIGSVDVDDPAGNLPALEDQTVAQLARLMGIQVTAAMLHNTGGRVDPTAYEDYLTALGYMQRFDKPGNLDRALAALERSTQTDPGFALGYAATGEAYRLKYQLTRNQQWLSEAQANCAKAVQLDNTIPAVYVTLAQIHADQGKRDLALAEFQHALTLNPNDGEAFEGLAHSYEQSGRIADAQKAFEKAVAMEPENWSGYNELGMFYDRRGKYPQSFAAYQKALALTPDNAEVYSNLAAAYIDAGDAKSLALAEQALKKSISISPSYAAYANLGMLYLQQKNYQSAAAATEAALHLDDHNYLVWNNLVLAYAGAHQTQKAVAARRQAEIQAERVVALNPQDAEAQSLLADMYAHSGQKAKATAKIATALALAPNDPNVLIDVGEGYEVMGNHAQALQYTEKAVAKGYPLKGVEDDPVLSPLLRDSRFKMGSK